MPTVKQLAERSREVDFTLRTRTVAEVAANQRRFVEAMEAMPTAEEFAKRLMRSVVAPRSS